MIRPPLYGVHVYTKARKNGRQGCADSGLAPFIADLVPVQAQNDTMMQLSRARTASQKTSSGDSAEEAGAMPVVTKYFVLSVSSRHHTEVVSSCS